MALAVLVNLFWLLPAEAVWVSVSTSSYTMVDGIGYINPGASVYCHGYHEWPPYQTTTFTFTNGINSYSATGANGTGKGGDFGLYMGPFAPGTNYHMYSSNGGFINFSGPFTVGYPDSVPPQSPSVSCSGGVNTLTVTLSLGATDNVGVTGCYIVESASVPTSPSGTGGGWLTIGPALNYTGNRSFVTTKNAGSKTVHVWFKDAQNNVSARASTTFTITDTIAPNGNFTISQPAGSVTGYFNSPNINLNLSVSDVVSDVTHYFICNDISAAPVPTDSGWKLFSSTPQQSYSSYSATHTLTGGDGAKSVYVWYKDAAGNIGAASGSPQTITLDTKAPITGSEAEDVSVSTFAGPPQGNTTPGDSDGTRNAASFFSPYGVAIDSLGNLFVADTKNHKIRKITPAGTVTTFAGPAPGSNDTGDADGTGNAARFIYPHGIVPDNSGNLFVADTYNNKIRKITPAGVVTTFAGPAMGSITSGDTDATGNAARFFNPINIEADNSGNLFVADGYNQKIRKITPAGVVTTFAGPAPGSNDPGDSDGTGNAARFNYPYGIAIDGSGNLYVGDTGNQNIRKITAASIVKTFAGPPPGSHPTGDLDGTGTAARFYSPYGIAVDNSGNLFIADSQNNKIRKIIILSDDGLLINNGAKLTTMRDLKMKIFGTDWQSGLQGTGVEKYCIRCNSSIAPAAGDSTAWLNMPTVYNNTYPATQEVDFTFTAFEPDGLKIFYLWFKDKAGNISSAAQKSIKFDTHPPVEPIAGSIAISGPHPEIQVTREVMLQLNAESGQDGTEGYYDIKVTNYFIMDNNLGTSVTPPTAGTTGWQTVTTPITPYSDIVPYTITSSSDGTKEIRVWYKDIAGNMSDSSECETYLDTSIPHGSFTINSGAEWSNSPLVMLNLNALSATAVSGYFVSENSATPSAADNSWRPVTPPVSSYTANVPYSLGRSSGVKTVYVWYKSTSGIVSAVSNSTIKLDCEIPEPGIELPGEWINVGSQGFSPGQVANASLFVYNGVPYVSFEDQANSAKATVMKFDGANWVYVGSPGFTSALAYLPSISIYNDTAYVAFSLSYGGPVSVMKFDGTNWVYVGSQGFSGVNPGYLSFYIYNGIPYVAFGSAPGTGSNKVVVMKFDGTNWVYVGTPEFSPGSSPYTSLYVYNGTPYVAYADYTNGQKISVMKFDGTSWVYVGNPLFSAGFVEFPSLCVFNGIPYVTYIDIANSRKVTVMAFNGTNWTPVGTPGFSSPVTDTTATAITALEMKIFNGKPCIAYSDVDKGGKISVMKFDGTNWIYVGTPGCSLLPANTVSLYFYKNAIYVAYRDSAATWKATVMKNEIKRSPGLDINNGEQYTNSAAIKLNLAAVDDYSGVAEYYASESPLPPDASTTWNTLTLSGGKADVNFNLSTVTKPVTVYVWFRDSAGNISSYSKKITNPRSMKAVESYGDSSTFNRPFLIARDSAENLIVADMPAVNTSPLFKLNAGAVPRYSAGSRIITAGSAIDTLREVVSGLVIFPGDYVGLIEDAKKRVAIFNAAGDFINGFAKSVDMIANYHGANTVSGARGVIFDKYNAAGGSINPFAEARVMANQINTYSLDLNFAAAAIDIFTDAAYSTTAGMKVSSSATLYIRVRGAGGDSTAINSIMLKARSSDDPKGIAVQLIETSSSSDIYTGTLALGSFTNLAAGVLGAGPKNMIYLSVHSKTGILNGAMQTRPKPPSGPVYIAELGDGGSIIIEMVRIPAGKFVMGQTGIATPTHEVTISKDFYMSKYEITQGQWLQVMGALASADKPLVSQSNTYNYGKGENYPVYYVSWNDICNSGGNDFMARINAVGLVDGTFRLPTEAEWEYACRAGTTSTYYWGEDASEATMKQYCWYDKNANSGAWTLPHAAIQGAQPAGQKIPNAFGLYDMSGNVVEWCSDWFGAYTSTAVTDPAGPASGSDRVFRGGSWGFGSNCRSADRSNNNPAGRYGSVCFRLVLPAGQ